MSDNTASDSAVQQPSDDGGIHAEGFPDASSPEENATGTLSLLDVDYVSIHRSSVCKKFYVESGNDKTVLYVLSIGLVHDNETLFSLEQEPWSTLLKKSLRPPKNSDLVHEIRRRATASNMKLPRPYNWTRIQMIEWLEQHPVSESVDVEFLTFEVLRLKEISLRMQQEQQQFLILEGMSGEAVARGGSWRGCIPYLRLIMTLTRDDVKSLFLSRGNCLSRSELDARNSDSR